MVCGLLPSKVKPMTMAYMSLPACVYFIFCQDTVRIIMAGHSVASSHLSDMLMHHTEEQFKCFLLDQNSEAHVVI